MSIDTNSSMYIGSTTLTLEGTNLTNNGTMNWLMGDIATPGLGDGRELRHVRHLRGSHDYGVSADFTNNGIFTVGLFNTNMSVNFRSPFTHNTGATLDVTGGILVLGAADTVFSAVSVNGGSCLTINGNYTAGNGAIINGAGTVEVNGVARPSLRLPA